MKALLRAAPLSLAVSALALWDLNHSPVNAQGAGAPPGANAPATAGPGRGAAQTWWSEKGKGAVYTAPNKPLWKLSELKKLHAGQNNWSEQVVRNAQQEASYNSAAPGTKFRRRMHFDTEVMFVVVAGEMRFDIEGQEPVTATRGSIVHVMESTIFSYDVAGTQNALWVEVAPFDHRVVYPGEDAAPAASQAGNSVVKVSFGHRPGTYTAPNLVHWNLFAATAACQPTGVKVDGDHLYASAITGYATPNDPENKCAAAGGRGGRGGRGGADGEAASPAPGGVFGHMHPGMAEWWIVQSGHIDGRFENGVFGGEEGDILYVPANTWHQMSASGPGLSTRLAISPYAFNNMNNTATSGQ
jgi:mannose-6-phosphate isomerase-like protein (cupin superfamily)